MIVALTVTRKTNFAQSSRAAATLRESLPAPAILMDGIYPSRAALRCTEDDPHRPRWAHADQKDAVRTNSTYRRYSARNGRRLTAQPRTRPTDRTSAFRGNNDPNDCRRDCWPP